MALLFLKTLEENLQGKPFIWVHKSYMVSVNKITSRENNELVIQQYRVLVSRNYRDQIMAQVLKNKVWVK